MINTSPSVGGKTFFNFYDGQRRSKLHASAWGQLVLPNMHGHRRSLALDHIANRRINGRLVAQQLSIRTASPTPPDAFDIKRAAGVRFEVPNSAACVCRSLDHQMHVSRPYMRGQQLPPAKVAGLPKCAQDDRRLARPKLRCGMSHHPHPIVNKGRTRLDRTIFAVPRSSFIASQMGTVAAECE